MQFSSTLCLGHFLVREKPVINYNSVWHCYNSGRHGSRSLSKGSEHGVQIMGVRKLGGRTNMIGNLWQIWSEIVTKLLWPVPRDPARGNQADTRCDIGIRYLFRQKWVGKSWIYCHCNVITILHLTSDRIAELACQRCIPDLVHLVTSHRKYDVHCTPVGYILCMTDPVSSATGKYTSAKLQATLHYKLQCQLMLYTSWLSWWSRGIYIKSRSKLTPTQPNHPQPLTLYPPHPRTPTPHSMSPQPTCTLQLMGTIR